MNHTGTTYDNINEFFDNKIQDIMKKISYNCFIVFTTLQNNSIFI